MFSQVEPAGRLHSFSLDHWDRSGGDPGSSLPHQSDHNPGDESPEDRQGSEAPQDGQGYPSSVGHSDAGSTSGRRNIGGHL